MPRKTNSLADALRGSVQPEPEPKRPGENRGQEDGSTRLVGAHFSPSPCTANSAYWPRRRAAACTPCWPRR